MKITLNNIALCFLTIAAFILTSQVMAQNEEPALKTSTSVLVENLQIYPNPVAGNTLYIKSPSQVRSVEVFNLLGKSILRMEDFSDDKQVIEINLYGFSKGVYLVHTIINNGQRFTEKVLLEN